MLHKAVLHRKHHKGQILMGWLVSDDIQLAIDGHKNVSGELKAPTYRHFLRLERITRCSCWFTRFVHRCRIHLMCILLSLRIIFIADFQLSVFCWFSFLHWMSTTGTDFTIQTTCFESSYLNVNNVNDRFFTTSRRTLLFSFPAIVATNTVCSWTGETKY